MTDEPNESPNVPTPVEPVTEPVAAEPVVAQPVAAEPTQPVTPAAAPVAPAAPAAPVAPVAPAAPAAPVIVDETPAATTTTTHAAVAPRGARGIGTFVIIMSIVMMVLGVVTYAIVTVTLADQEITVADDARFFAGAKVQDPLTAWSQANTIGKHAEEIADGQTYAQLDQDDPRRDTVMTASFLQASLFTSVVAFGVALLVIGLGFVMLFVGIALRRLSP
jgi:hypothetical protein